MTNVNLKSKKSVKILTIVFCLFMVLSTFTVSCFAANDDGLFPAGEYRWVENPEFDLLNSYTLDSVTGFYFMTPSGDYSHCFSIDIYYRGYWVMSFNTSSGAIDVYYDGVWVEESYRTVFYQSSFDPGDNYDFYVSSLLPIQELPDAKFGIYSSIFAVLQEFIYGDLVLTPDMRLTLTLVSTLGCLLVVGVPFYLCYFVLRLCRFL